MRNTFFFLILLLFGTTVHAQWIQKGMDIDGETADDQSGRSISMSSNGNTIAIGAYKNDGAGTDAGHVRIYEWNGTSWTQKGLDIDGEAADDRSGYSVSMSSDGNTIAIGAVNNDGTASNAGHVRVYEWNDTAWIQKGLDIDGEANGDNSGFSVSMSSDGNTLAIGAWYNDGTGINSGNTRIYEWNGMAWTQKGAEIDGEGPNDLSGYSVSISSDGSTIAIGANLNDGSGANSGHSRVYEWNGIAWTQKGMDIDGESTDDNSGRSVSMSSNGNTIAIGAYKNDGTGTDAGHVRIYEWNGTGWTQKGLDIDGEAADDLSGYSISLSSDGSSLAIGAYLNDGTATDAGHVRVYEINTVGVLENSFGNNLLVYPNPTKGNFSIDLRENFNSIKLSIVDINGRLIQTTDYNSSQIINLNIAGPTGIYLLTLESAKQRAVIRIVKQ